MKENEDDTKKSHVHGLKEYRQNGHTTQSDIQI